MNKKQFRPMTITTTSNEALVTLLMQATGHKSVKVIITPRVDVNGHAYYWVGVRYEHKELDFKLLVTPQITEYILAYLKGEDTLPFVTNFIPTETVADVDEWIRNHYVVHSVEAKSRKEEIKMTDDVSYLTSKLIFPNGRVNYPSVKCDDVLSLILD